MLALGIVGLGAAATGLLFSTSHNATVYWNLGANSHRWYYIHPVLFGATAVLGIVAVVAGVRGVKSPARPLVSWLPWALAALILLPLRACASTVMARVYLV